MSMAVEEWVWTSCPVVRGREFDRYVLLAIAWHCPRGDGVGACPEERTLAAMLRVDRKTVRAAIERLEERQELLVWRAPDTVRGRRPPNRYAVVMGRPLDDVRALEELRHRPHTSAPAAGSPHPSPAGTDRSRRTHTSVRPRSTPGPAPVQPRSSSERRKGPEAEAQAEVRRASAARSSPARAAPPPDDPRLDPLRRELSGINVSWHMSSEQTEIVAALLAVHGARTLANAALEQVDVWGPPTFARAWLKPWRKLPMPGGDLRPRDSIPAAKVAAQKRWCGQCAGDDYRWEVDEDELPLRPCPRCHQTSTAPAPF
jgi:hypothetical protein